MLFFKLSLANSKTTSLNFSFSIGSGSNLTRSQLLEGLKEKSQIEDNGKREGVRARSLTRSTRGVEGVLELRD
jgi:hypothetical protein